jgi:hypothetical protein
MKLRIGILAAAAALALAGCGDKKDEGGGAADPGGAADQGGGAGKAIDEATAAAISETRIEGFEAQASPPQKTSATVYYTAKDKLESGQQLKVSATVQKCVMCQKMDLAAWKANENLKSMLSKASKEDPELVWEVEEVDLGGKKGIYTYALAYNVSEDGKSRSGTNGYNIWYNDGINQIWLQTMCHGGFGPDITDEASYEAACPREAQLEAAKQVFAAFATYF